MTTYPIVTELRKKNEICRNKINDFEKKYKTIYQELVYLLNRKEYEALNEKVEELKMFMQGANQDITKCYNDLQREHHKYLANEDGDFQDSYIDQMQQSTAEKYDEFQKQLVELNRLQSSMKTNSDEHATLLATMAEEGSNVDSVYYLFYVWIIITMILISGVILYMSNHESSLNTIVVIVAISVSFYFILKNIL